MAAKKRSGPDPKRVQARAAMKAAAARRQRNRIIAGVVTIAVIAAVILAFSVGGSNDTNKAATTNTSATRPAAASAAGKPCKPLADPLPSGSPNVPIKAGPPPKTLVKEDLKQGTGAEVKASDTLTVNYIGVSCSTGKIFDSSYSRNQPATFPLSGVIKGWQDGIPGMKVGGQRLLVIPPDLAYGPQGRPGIAGGETLWFVVEVLEAKPS